MIYPPTPWTEAAVEKANEELDKKKRLGTHTWARPSAFGHVTEAQLLDTDFLKIYECNFEEQKYFENKSKKVGVSGFNSCKTWPEKRDQGRALQILPFPGVQVIKLAVGDLSC